MLKLLGGRELPETHAPNPAVLRWFAKRFAAFPHRAFVGELWNLTVETLAQPIVDRYTLLSASSSGSLDRSACLRPIGGFECSVTLE
jgi:hypothetical protein